MTRYASRKFILAALGVVLASGALYLQLLDGAQWVQALTACLGSYMLGNVGDTWAEK